MKRRSSEILYRLVNVSGHRMRLSTLIDDYHISERTLQLDISSIAEFARNPHGGSLVRQTAHHVQLIDESSAQAIHEMLDSMDLYEYQLSQAERRDLIIVMLLVASGRLVPGRRGKEETPKGGYVTLQQMADKLYVSRNTVITDCKVADCFLERYGLAFMSGGRYGLKLEATPEQCRDLLIDLFAEELSQSKCKDSYFMALMENWLGYDISLREIASCVRGYLRSSNMLIAIEAEQRIVATMGVMLNDLAWHRAISSSNEADTGSVPAPIVEEVQLDTIGILVREVASRAGVVLSSSEIVLIERIILAENIQSQIRRFDDFDLYCAIAHFLLLVGTSLGIGIQNDDLLVEALISHIKCIIDWNSDSFDWAADEMQLGGSVPSGSMVDIVRAATEPHFHVLEEYFHRTIDKGMKSSIVIHICAALYRSQDSARACKVIIVSPAQDVTRRYLEAQIHNYFKFDVVGSALVHDVEDGVCDTSGADFVISTVPIANACVPTVVVSPLLSVEDINKIQEVAFRHNESSLSVAISTDGALVSQLQTVYAQGNPRKVAYLDRALRAIIKRLDELERDAIMTSRVLAVMRRHFIQVFQGPLSWRDAIRLVSDPLLEEGCVSQAYVDKAIANVEDYGSYIIINQGIALAHASASDGASKDALGLLVSSEGVCFDGGETVNLMFFSAQLEEDYYIDLFREINRLGNDTEGFRRIVTSRTPDEAYHHLVETLTDYGADM